MLSYQNPVLRSLSNDTNPVFCSHPNGTKTWPAPFLCLCSNFTKPWTAPLFRLRYNGTKPWPTPFFCSCPNGINPWMTPFFHLISNSTQPCPTPLFFYVPMAQIHGRGCLVYLLFYISRNIASCICSKQVSNSFLFLIK